MERQIRDNLRICAFLLVWTGCWFGGWIAGGMLFPAYGTPAMIGAFLGFWIGCLGGAVLTRMDRVSSR